MKFEFKAKHLLALKLFAAKEDVRFYLKSILLSQENGTVRLLASDGHRLLIINEAAAPDALGNFNCLLPIEAFDKLKPKSQPVLIDVNENADGFYDLEIRIDGRLEKIASIQARYPEMRKVFPPDIFEEEKPPHLSHKYVGELDKLAKILGFKDFEIHFKFSGEASPAYFSTPDDNVVGLIMPIREKVRGSLPTWWKR